MGQLARESGRPALPHALPHTLPHEAWGRVWDTEYLMGGVVSYSQAGSLDCCHITSDEPTRVISKLLPVTKAVEPYHNSVTAHN